MRSERGMESMEMDSPCPDLRHFWQTREPLLPLPPLLPFGFPFLPTPMRDGNMLT